MGKVISFFRLIYFGIIMAIAGVRLLISLPRPFHKNNTYPIAIFMRIFVTPVLGIEFEIEGQEKAVAAQPCVFISNHQNNYDIVVAAEAVPPGTVSLGKKQMIFFPFLDGIIGWRVIS